MTLIIYLCFFCKYFSFLNKKTILESMLFVLFYAFAMQCMSTLAIVKRETNSWKWPMWQLFVMSGIAYVVALAAYQLLK